MIKIFLASDHGGFELKQKIQEHLSKQAYELVDLGCPNGDKCDYPEFGQKAAEAVVAEEGSFAIIICGSGIGISIAANRVKGARCVLANTVELAELGRQHNGANMLAMGARTKGYDDPIEILEAFLKAELDPADRHARRRAQLDA